MKEQIESFLKYLAVQKGLSENSLIAYKKDLFKFENYFAAESLDLEGLKRFEFRGFLAELNRQKLCNKTINRILAAIKGFIKYKIRFGYKDTAGILEVESQKTSRYLPTFLFDEEIDQLISFKCSAKEDYRDRAIFELIFSTGIRISELVSLNIDNFNSSQNEIRITGKGDKERIVLYGNRCKKYFQEYLLVRKNFLQKFDEKALFLNKNGKRIGQRGIRYVLSKRIQQVALKKKYFSSFSKTFFCNLTY